MSDNYIPEPTTLIETASGLQTISVRAKQLSEGIIHINGDITDELANSVIMQMMHLISEGKDIYLMINNRGGSWSAGLAIVDVIKMYPDRVHTICTSCASAVGAVILSSPSKGNRYIFSHANVIVVEPSISQDIHGSERNIQGYINGLKYTKSIVLELLSINTSHPEKEISSMVSDECFLTALDAIDFGLVDKVVEDLMMINNKI